MKERKDYTGEKHYRLLVLGLSHISKNGKSYWNCLCDCGNITKVAMDKLGKSTKSCGCYRNEMRGASQRTHGMTKTRIYNIWCNIIKRCTVETDEAYPRYGGRGIKMCERWRNSFELFYEDTKEGYRNDMTIDRYPDNNGNYEPGNFRWATREEQANNKRNNVVITHKGVTLTLAQWTTKLGIKYKAFHKKLRKGYPPEKIFHFYE